MAAVLRSLFVIGPPQISWTQNPPPSFSVRPCGLPAHLEGVKVAVVRKEQALSDAAPLGAVLEVLLPQKSARSKIEVRGSVIV